MVQRELKLEYVPIDELKPFAKNPRKISEAGLEKIRRSIEQFGFANPILVQQGTNVIIAGHQRWKAAKAAGLDRVPVVYLDMDDETAKAYNIADNRTAEEAEWEPALLSELMSELKDIGFDLTLTGFEDKEIGEILNWAPDEGVIVEEDNPPAPPDESITKPGCLWLLGDHRLLCGDATVKADMDKLMAGQLADMVFTDPPYNVDYTGGTSEALKIKNDNMDDSAFYNFLHDAFSCMLEVTKPGGGIYVCHADSEGINFRSAMVNAGWLLKQCIIWVKNSLVLSRQDYHWRHEPILYGWKPGAAHTWYGGRDKDTVWETPEFLTVEETDNGCVLHFTNGSHTVVLQVPSYEVVSATHEIGTTVWRVERPTRNAEHPTMKPIELIARALRNSSKPGDVILDPFGGSGSTLIACEQLGRSCYTMELDPRYCDVIVERWQNFTGKKAKRG